MNSFVPSRPRLLTALKVNDVPYHKTMSQRCSWVKKWICKHYDIPPRTINRGYCFIFAYVVAALTPHRVHFFSDLGHVVVFDPETKKYHDSDHVRGCLEWKRLDIRGYCCDPEMMNLRVMQTLWSARGIHNDKFIKLVDKIEGKEWADVLDSNSCDDDMLLDEAFDRVRHQNGQEALALDYV